MSAWTTRWRGWLPGALLGEADRQPGREADRRWVVVDVESSGLDAEHDRLLAIAATALHLGPEGPRVAFDDSFEVVLRQSADAAPPDKANILLHGIGVGAQRAGESHRPLHVQQPGALLQQVGTGLDPDHTVEGLNEDVHEGFAGVSGSFPLCLIQEIESRECDVSLAVMGVVAWSCRTSI